MSTMLANSAASASASGPCATAAEIAHRGREIGQSAKRRVHHRRQPPALGRDQPIETEPQRDGSLPRASSAGPEVQHCIVKLARAEDSEGAVRPSVRRLSNGSMRNLLAGQPAGRGRGERNLFRPPRQGLRNAVDFRQGEVHEAVRHLHPVTSIAGHAPIRRSWPCRKSLRPHLVARLPSNCGARLRRQSSSKTGLASPSIPGEDQNYFRA